MKAEILALLRENTGYVSGQQMCLQFGVTRAAVWKAVNQLKKEGYQIEAVPNRGYHLISEQNADGQDVYGQNELSSLIRTGWAGKPVLFLEEVDSTNTRAKLEAEAGAAHGTVIAADRQTAGRGRRGRTWNSPAGTNLSFSLILKPEFSPNQASMLTLVMAHSVARAVAQMCGVEAGIKWPNDIVVNGKKVCGILTEMSAEPDYIHYVVIGAGINVKEQAFPPELLDKATCLERECGHFVGRGALLARIMELFEEDYALFLKTGDCSGFLDSYNALLVNRGKEVCVMEPKGEYRGTALGIKDSGELLVRTEDGSIQEVYAGEVSVRGIYGYV